jgi:hypothetical protein
VQLAKDALFAVTAGGKQPRNAYARAWPWMVHACTDTLNRACDLVARNDGKSDEGEFAIPNHQVPVAHTAGADSDQNVAGSRCRDRALFDLKLAFRFFQNSGPMALKGSGPIGRESNAISGEC